MPRIVEIPDVARLSFPDDLSDDAVLEATRNFYEQSKQGALGAAGAATVREPPRTIGKAMKAAARLTDWLQPPDVNPETGIPIWQQAESTFLGPETVTPVEKPAPVPVEQTGLYQAGESLQRGAEKMFPVSPLREQDFLTQVGSGIGSSATSFIPYLGPAIYAGSTAEDAAEKAGRFYDNKIAEAMAAGNGAEASRLQEEKKYQQALQFGLNAPLGYATERFLGVVPGLKQITQGGGKLIPKLAAGQTVENTKKLAGYFAKQGVKPTVGEFAQEGLEQVGGNVSEMAYNPEAEFTAGVLDASGVGGTVGAITSIPLALLGSKLRKNRLDRLQEFRDTRLAEGPLSDQQINEINNRIVAGQPFTEPEPGSILDLLNEDPAARSSVGGNNAELLPNATATLAGINSGGAPSGPINIVPPTVTGGAPGEEAKIPDIALETDVVDEETPVEVTAVAPETVAASETSTPAAPTEVQPLSIEDTQEYLAMVNAIGEGDATDILNEEEITRFEDYVRRIRQLQNAGFQFDEVNGWVKIDTTAGVQPAFAATPAEVPATPAETPVAPATPTPAAAPVAPVTSRTFPFQDRKVDGMIDRDTGDIIAFAKSIVGTPDERGSSPKYTIKVDQDVTIDASSEKALDNALQKISSGAPVRVFRNAGKGVTLDFNEPGPVTPAQRPAPGPPICRNRPGRRRPPDSKTETGASWKNSLGRR